MSEIKPDTFPKQTANPILAGLPEHLKDPENYEKIRRALLETLASPHSHSDILAWYDCKNCKSKIRDHRLMMQKLGFQSPAQYMEWQKVHLKIQEFKKVKLPKYNSK